MGLTLDEYERRVLGALIEKSLAQPTYYPMTINALVAACNQKNNRDPVMDLDEDDVSDTVEALRRRNLVTRIMPGGGSRVDRYRHEIAGAESGVGWDRREQAVMAELLLRGPQTVGELRGRCSRMTPFEDLEAVSAVLDVLGQREPPQVTALPREPGRSAVRLTHLLYPADEGPATSTPEAANPVAPPAVGAAAGEVDSLRDQLADLTAELDEIRQSLAELKSRMDRMEAQWS